MTAGRKVLLFRGRDNPGGAPLTERAGYVNAWRSGKNRLSDDILFLGRMATRTKENPATSTKRPGRGQGYHAAIGRAGNASISPLSMM